MKKTCFNKIVRSSRTKNKASELRLPTISTQLANLNLFGSTPPRIGGGGINTMQLTLEDGGCDNTVLIG